jgi:Tfp pilus assembly protein PilF
MKRYLNLLSVLALAGMLTAGVRADDLRHVKHGETLPVCKLPTMDGAVVDSETMKGSVVVYVCLSAEQRRSELAATESQQVVKALSGEPVRLVHITADAIKKPYYELHRKEHDIKAPLAIDADRVFYGKLGIIAFPTTIIVDKEGKLDNVITLHGSSYKDQLDAHVRHALGMLSDQQLEQKLAAKPAEHATPKTAAAAHRSLARVMREKGQLDAAREELKKGLEMDPENREVMLDLADVNTVAGDLDGADVLLGKVLAGQADNRRAKQLKGTVLMKRGKLDEAQALLEESLNMNANPELVHYYLGQIFEKKGAKDKAMEHYREALKAFIREPGAAPAAVVPAGGPAGGAKPAK